MTTFNPARPALAPDTAATLRAAHEQQRTGQPVRRIEEGDDLSARELEVLRMVADGTPRARIARRLFVSEDTVKTHLQRMYRKLGATDRASAVHRGHVTGLLP